MTSFSTQLLETLSSRHLLKHPFYQSWTDGSLSRETIQKYARQYFKHVSAFPRYLSATHSNCENLASRQVLLENLLDEERGPENHPKLWMDFATGMGNTEESVLNEEALPATQDLVDTFMSLSKSSYAEGIGALFAYEHQIPEIAQFKNEALEKHYDVKAGSSTQTFFNVHAKADVYHTAAVASLLDNLNPADKEKAKEASIRASAKLWQFLDEMQAIENSKHSC